MKTFRRFPLFLPVTALLAFVLLQPVPVFAAGQSDTDDSGVPAGESVSESESRSAEREQLVDRQLVRRDIIDEKVLDAMRQVPRHKLVPREQRSRAYNDSPLPIGYGQTISQPYIVAYMTELLQLQGDERVLEIGTGSGYQAAVLAEITPYVYSIEIIEQLGVRVREDLSAAGYGDINLKIADGYFGWEEQAPFDAILVTAAAGHVPQPLINQLKPGGKIVIPIGGVYQVQQLTVVRKDADGNLSTEQLMPVRFVPMTGEALDE